MSPTLHIDLETRSAADLKKVGAHRYAEDPTTSIICASYRFNDGQVKRWLGEEVPDEVFDHVADGLPVAGHNQQFERCVWNARIGVLETIRMRPEQQDCTMARAAAMGLPHSLDNLGKALNLKFQKDKDGHALMMRMCKPRTREPEITWHEDAADVQRLAAYCDRDVETECDADTHVPALSERERRVWILDQKINDRGFAVDLPLVQAAHHAVIEAQRRADDEMWRITGGAITKATQTKKLAEWVQSRGIPCTSVADEEIDDLLVGADMLDDKPVEAALTLRRNSAGAFKFEAMLRAVCSDGRIRGTLQYHGTHGGRWAGRVVQPQNFKRVSEEQEEQVALAMDLLRRYGASPAKALDAMQMLLDIPPLEALSLCARPMIIARPGHELLDADFSNIEGRLNAWFAGSRTKVAAFEAFDRGEGHDMYKVTAASILGKDPGDVTKSERQDWGKVPELACGYQGGWRALQKQASKLGLTLARGRATEIVTGWRESPLNHAIVDLWAEVQQAAIDAVRAPGLIVPALRGKVQYLKPQEADFLWCCLPSGRVISYAQPRVGWTKKVIDVDGEQLELDNFGLTFWGQKSGRWMKLDLYGGMQCAHIVSGTARDLLVEAMFAVEAQGVPVILSVHDELLAEVPAGRMSADEFKAIIAQSKPEWADGLPLVSAAWKDVRYVK